MKKGSTWAGIIGLVLLATTLYGEAQNLTHPTDLPWVNVVEAINAVIWLAFEAFLIGIFLIGRQKEDAGHVAPKHEAYSPEDTMLLAERRNWILGFVLLVGVVLSTEPWFLNNYLAGFTYVNIFVIFDVVTSLALLYAAAQLFRGQKALSLTLVTVAVYAIGEAVLEVLRGHWYVGFLNLFFLVYVTFALQAPLNRKNFRIAHLVLLPIFVVLFLSSTFFDNGKLVDLNKNEALLEQTFTNDNSALNGDYQLYLQKDVPDRTLMTTIKSEVEKRNADTDAIAANLSAIHDEYNKQLPTIFLKKTLEQIRFQLEIISIDRQQADAVTQLMDYSLGLDFNHLTDAEREHLAARKQAILGYINKITQKQFEENNAYVGT